MAKRLLHPLNANLPNAEAIRQESDTTLRTFVNNLTAHSAQLKEHGFINLKHLLREVRAVVSAFYFLWSCSFAANVRSVPVWRHLLPLILALYA